MGKKKPFDIEAARDEIERLEARATSLEYQMEDEVDEGVRMSYRAMINRALKAADRLQRRITEEEDARAQEYFNDPESIARDEAMKQSNKDALDRWRAEHPDTPCYAEPNKDE